MDNILNIDADLQNADWTKKTWDLAPIDSGEFKALLKSWGMTMEQFKTLPVYKNLIKSQTRS